MYIERYANYKSTSSLVEWIRLNLDFFNNNFNLWFENDIFALVYSLSDSSSNVFITSEIAKHIIIWKFVLSLRKIKSAKISEFILIHAKLTTVFSRQMEKQLTYILNKYIYFDLWKYLYKINMIHKMYMYPITCNTFTSQNQSLYIYIFAGRIKTWRALSSADHQVVLSIEWFFPLHEYRWALHHARYYNVLV